MCDAESAAALAASSWEEMRAQAAEYEGELVSEHCRALEELLGASFEASQCPGALSETRLVVAEIRLGRVERRLGKHE